MKPLPRLRARGSLGPPVPEDTFETLRRSHGPKVKTGRSEQFNTRVALGFPDRVRHMAKAERVTLGALLDAMMAAFEAQGASVDPKLTPIAESRAGRTREVRFWATEFVYGAIGKVAAERQMSVSALLEELLAHEVHRLDPHGGKFGVYVER